MTEIEESRRPMGLLAGNRSALILGSVVVGVFGIGAAIAILALRDQLPDPIATHFAGGIPDGFESVTTTAILAAAFTVGLGAIIVALGAMVPGKRWMRRTMFGLGIGTAVFVSLTFLAATLPQVGLVDAVDARVSWSAFLIPIAAAALLGWALSSLVRE